MKPVLPSLREKKRYITFEVITPKNLNHKDVHEQIKKTATKLLGTLGMAKTGLQSLPDWKKNCGIIRVERKQVEKIKTAMTLTKKIKDQNAIIKTITTSGILKKSRKKI